MRYFPFVFCSCSSWRCPSPASPRLWQEPTWRAPSPRSRGGSTSPAPTLDSSMAVLRWVTSFFWTKLWSLGNFFRSVRLILHPLFLGFRQLVVSCCGQPFRGQVAPSQAHCCWLFPHGCGGLSHWPHALLHGTVHYTWFIYFFFFYN